MSAPTTSDCNQDAARAHGSSLQRLVRLPPVLDACCGGRMMWFDKQDPRALFMDIREGVYPVKAYARPNKAPVVVAPDVVASFEDMPFPDNSFDLVVFDPPHLSKLGDTSTLAKTFGKLLPDWRDSLARGFAECFRVLRPSGTLIFKWCEFEIPIGEMLALTPEKPLFGHRSGKRAETHWVAFLKPNKHSTET